MTTDPTAPTVNIGTILLEPARWATPKRATCRVADWLDRFRDAGFDGMELWEYHASALEASTFPVAVYNAYCGFDGPSAAARAHALEDIGRLRAQGVKFNVGGDVARRREYGRNLREWVAALPGNCRPLCECHGGTIVETPEAARAFMDDTEVDCGIIVHAFTGTEDLLRAWLDLFGSAVELVHVQIRDAGRFLRLDEAPALARRRLAMLREARFRGAYTLEFTKGTSTERDNPEALWREALVDLAFLREHA
ncbi:hypothetical protein CMK11_06505 [Candidatus Poribacteria bacterium]|jgi:hypothetical protein|nr:hypothetical protein [Candidatus Poribacteria bacterium]